MSIFRVLFASSLVVVVYWSDRDFEYGNMHAEGIAE